jgi:transposase
MPLSADTLIRRIKGAARLSALPRVIRVLGVDDWAWCKGQNFGTILVDLERRQVVDLLPTRSAESFGEWLAQHPEVTTVSRDRQGVYAEGARRGAPEAVQVADRFHLVLNLTQAAECELAVNRRHLRIASPRAPALPLSPTTEEVKIQTEQVRVRSSIVPQQMEVARQRRQQKLELFGTIKQMRAAGLVFGFRAILRGGKVTTLHRWMEEARKTGIHSLDRFVRTLKQDLSAVEAAVRKPWSNGPVEGHIDRLKMLKRQMYGRAGIELLRARLLPEPALRDP